MRTALMIATATLAIMPLAAQNTPMPVDPPIPEDPMPDAAPETPAPPPAPMPPATPAPEIPQPTPAPPTAPGPVVAQPRGPMATPPSAGAPVARSGATTMQNLQPVMSTKKYPVCSKTVTDNCVNRGGR